MFEENRAIKCIYKCVDNPISFITKNLHYLIIFDSISQWVYSFIQVHVQ